MYNRAGWDKSALVALDEIELEEEEEFFDELLEEDDPFVGLGRNDVERFEFSGVTLDPGRMAAYLLSY